MENKLFVFSIEDCDLEVKSCYNVHAFFHCMSLIASVPIALTFSVG